MPAVEFYYGLSIRARLADYSVRRQRQRFVKVMNPIIRDAPVSFLIEQNPGFVNLFMLLAVFPCFQARVIRRIQTIFGDFSHVGIFFKKSLQRFKMGRFAQP